MADYDTLNEDPAGVHGADQHDFSVDPVWGDLWNPTPNTWAPTMEPYPGYGEDASTVEYQDHGDQANATPMVEQWGRPDPSVAGGGSTPSAAANVLTDVRTPKTAVGPTVQMVQHEVHTYETGSEIARVRQVQLAAGSNVQPVNVLEENQYRKRALIRLVPVTTTTLQQTFSGTGSTIPIVVPAGQTWTLQSISFLYTASANVANRNVRVRIQLPGGANLYTFVDSTALTASQIANVSLAPGNPTQHTLQTGSNFTIQGNLPAGLVLPAGASILVDAIGIDAADTMTGGIVQATVTQGTSSAAVFIAPRSEGAGAGAAPSAWYKLALGDPPIELKTQQGVDALTTLTTDVAVLQVYEEIIRDGAQKLTGIV